MKSFTGFPDRMEFTPVPNVFLSAVLPEITDPAELKATLYLIAALYRKKGWPRFVTFQEVLASPGLVKSLGEQPEQALHKALNMAAERGTVIHLQAESDSAVEDIYLLNTESNQGIAARIQSGEIKLGGLKPRALPPTPTEKQPDIFALYEQNIGMLTPMIADELREAEKHYPQEWLNDAFKEAVALNKRNWRYIIRILERWASEGKSDGAYPRDTKTDPDKYVKGQYGRMVRR